ncbi:MAG: hypothetical protein AB4352_25615 [Hormoscilla sp.]
MSTTNILFGPRPDRGSGPTRRGPKQSPAYPEKKTSVLTTNGKGLKSLLRTKGDRSGPLNVIIDK